MLAFIIGFLSGLVFGIIGAVFVARNNKSKIEKALATADKVSDRYKDYMNEYRKPDDLKK